MKTDTFKRCSQCRIEKPLLAFHTHIRKKGGYDSMCIECKKELKGKFKGHANQWDHITFDDCKYYADRCKTRAEYLRDYLAHYSIAKKNKWLDILIPIETTSLKVCSCCNKEKTITEFYNTKGNTVDGKTSTCKECNKIKSKKLIKEWSKITHEECKIKSELCKSKKEFALKYNKYYNSSRVNKWLDEFYPALKYDRNRVIYSYVFSDNCVYVGLTCQPKQRHRQHMSMDKSSVFQYMDKTGQIPEWNILTGYVDQIESKRLERLYIKRYKTKGYSILNKAEPGGLGGGVNTITIERAIELAKKCKTRSEMWKKSSRLYNLLRENRLLDKYFERYNKDRSYAPVKWTYEACANECKKYRSRSELDRNNSYLYKRIKKNGWIDELLPSLRAC